MKEASSELMSVLVVIVSVAVLIAFFFFTIWPMIDNNFKKQTSCDKAVCSSNPENGYVSCTLDGDTYFSCPYKG